jgi:hypothetical protein
MGEHLRALLVILGFAILVFLIAKTPACDMANTEADFARRRTLWFAVTLVAFLSHNFWAFIVITAALLLFANRFERNPFALFLALLFAVPPIEVQIPGLGLFDQLFTMTYLRLLSLTILLPAFLALRTRPGVEPFGRTGADKILLWYMILFFLLMLRGNTFTNSLRHGILYGFLDVFLPYYVASRSLRRVEDFRDAIMAFIVGAMVMSAIGAFEYLKGWLLYVNLDEALGVPWWSSYLSREDSVRAQASMVQPIPMGYAIATAAGLYLYVARLVRKPLFWSAGLILLLAGLYAPVSRGPWFGFAAIVLIFILIGPAAVKRLAVLGALGVCALPPLLLTDAGERFINRLPFIGNLESFNVTYRQRLLEISVEVISKQPLFGAHDYYSLPEMQSLVQGQGIIDVVNTYLQVGLERGLVGLSLFVGFLSAVAIGVFKMMRRVPDRNDERYLLGQTLFATQIGVMIMIVSVSGISVVPVIYWSMAGLCAGYTLMIARSRIDEKVAVGDIAAAHGAAELRIMKKWHA